MPLIFWKSCEDRGWFLWGTPWTGTCGSPWCVSCVKVSGTRSVFLKFQEKQNLRRKMSTLLDLR